MAANATRLGTIYQIQTFDATPGRPQHWLAIPQPDCRNDATRGRPQHWLIILHAGLLSACRASNRATHYILDSGLIMHHEGRSRIGDTVRALNVFYANECEPDELETR